MADTKPGIDPGIYKILVEQAKDYAVFVLDPGGHIMTWNLGARRTKGYEAEEIIGKHFSVFYTRDAVDSGWPAHELRVAKIEGRFEDEGWRVRKDGSRFWASVVITALRDPDGGLLGFSKFTRDLTERKEHDRALRQSEERFRLLVEGVSDYAIYMLDPDGLVSSWNAGAQRIKGYSRKEILGKHFSHFYSQEDIDAGKPWDELARARRTGRAEDEGWRVRKNGERFWARAVLTALHDTQGHLRGFAKVTQDLTERRYVQDLESAARNVNEFIAMLAHELRNPLAPIRAAVEVMARIAPGDPTHEAMRQTIDRQSTHLSRIVDDMLDIARITRGALVIEPARLDLAEVVQRAIETAAPAIQAAKHSLHNDAPAGQVFVHGDAARLTQLVANLLNNSARYTAPGGRISIKVGREGSWAALQVRDTGRGIEAGMLDRIFEMFVQAQTPPLDRASGGLGIGLALARRIAELHGGSLQAHSEGEGKGSEFALRLPLLTSAEVPKQEAGEGAAQSTARPALPQRVLVVDDNADAAITLAMLLKSLGHETSVVNDGLQALKRAVEFRPDVVLLDIGMPGLDGYEVARRLRALNRDRPLRIVAITGWGQEADRKKSQEAGFDLHLVKPVDPNDLAKALSGRNGATLH